MFPDRHSVGCLLCEDPPAIPISVQYAIEFIATVPIFFNNSAYIYPECSSICINSNFQKPILEQIYNAEKNLSV